MPTAPPPLGQPLRAQPQRPTFVGPPARLQPLPGTMRPGDTVVVPASLWPAYTCRELGGAGWTATVRRVHTSTARVSFDIAQTRDGRPYEDEPLPLDELRVAVVYRPDFPPTSPCGNRDFWANVPHRNRDHRAYGAVRRVHSFFPYNVTDARRWVLCVARYVFLQRTFTPWGARVGALGGQYRAANRHLDNSEFTGLPLDNSELRSGLPYLATTSETERSARCAAAPRSEFRACERDPPPSPIHLQCVYSRTRVGSPSLRCGASCTFILSLQRHGRKKRTYSIFSVFSSALPESFLNAEFGRVLLRL